MLLAINSGNTNASFAVYDGDKQRGRWRISTDPRRTADEYGVWLSQLMGLKGLKPADIDGAIIASVVPDALFNLKTLVRSYFNCNPLVIGDSDGNHLGIKASIDRPEEAGADRLVNAYAAHQRYGGPAIVVDFGTATTFDIVDKNGAYAGGVIAPGINLSLQALYMAAAKLPNVAIEKPKQVIGKSTVPAMQSGVFWGYVGPDRRTGDTDQERVRRADEGNRHRRPGADVQGRRRDPRAHRWRPHAGRLAVALPRQREEVANTPTR